MGEVVNTREPLLEMFIFETTQFLEQLESILLEAEKKDSLSKEEIDEIFRMMHTTKSSSAVIGLSLLSQLSHRVEDVFDYIRQKGIKQKLKVIGIYDVLLKVLDYMNNAISRFQKGEKEEEISGLLEELSALLERIKEAQTLEKMENEEDKRYRQYKMHITFTEGSGMENIRAFNIIHILENDVKDIRTMPAHVIEDAEATEYIVKHGFQMFFSSDLAKDALEQMIEEVLYIKTYEIIELNEEASSLLMDGNNSPNQELKREEPIVSEGMQQISSEKNTGIKQSLININTYKLDRLLDFVGEISIAQSMVIKNPDLEGLDLPRFNKAARQLKKLTDELQDIVMAMRMVSIGHTFYKMERVVRDMCKQLGKEAELIIKGEQTEVDQGTMITLRIPLTLAIVGGMQVQTGDEIYTILTTHIRESFRAKKKDIITTPEGKEYIQIREDIYPVLRLQEYFYIQSERTDLTKGMILLVENEEKQLCIFVDQLIGEQQVVIKGLPHYLEQSPIKKKGIVGLIILGDGRISLVIDVMTLLNTTL